MVIVVLMLIVLDFAGIMSLGILLLMVVMMAWMLFHGLCVILVMFITIGFSHNEQRETQGKDQECGGGDLHIRNAMAEEEDGEEKQTNEPPGGTGG